MVCRLCGSPNIKHKFLIDNFSPSFSIAECKDCRFQFQEIQESETYAFYDESYYSGKAAFSYIDERKNEEASRIVWKKRFSYLRKRARNQGPKRFLDVGCSFGGLMQIASENNFDVYGAEVSEYSGNFAAGRFGKDRLFIGNIEDISLPDDYFSIVTMVEVIEHLYNPEKSIRNIYRSMQEGGLLLIQTANMAGLQAVFGGNRYHYYLPGHLSYFSRTNLENLLRQTGFRKVKFIGGVEFGLLPKLLKSRADFKKIGDYLKWIRISWYHLKSRIALGPVRLTSSMVVLAWK
ncbi:MAG: class I SAM-dependent methyltransferase [Patescibacteria group bacterium]|nr:class I SAM-dependent methyltransferase [Patescibacteria group bacterium]